MTPPDTIIARRPGATLLKPLLLALVFATIAWGGITLTRDSSRVAALWLPNAIVLAVILRSHSAARYRYLIAGLCGNIIANHLAGDSVMTALPLALINMAEVIAAWFMLEWRHKEPLDMCRLGDLGKLALVGILAPVVSGTLAAIVLSSSDSFLSMTIWWSWIASDGLGLLIVTPVTMIAIDTWRGRRTLTQAEISEWAIFVFLAFAVSIGVFAQTRYPFLFLVCPIAIIAAFRIGIPGTAVAVTIISLVASVATTLGYGPIMLVRGDLPNRLLVLQLFLASTFLMALPVAAALASRSAMRRELRESRDFAELILANMTEVVFRADAQGRWIFLNPAWEKVTGYTVAESLGWPSWKLLLDEELEETRIIYPKIASGEVRETQLEQRFTNASGDIRHIAVNVRRLTDEHDRFIGTTGNIRDVTLRKIAEAQMLASEARFRLLAEAAPVGIFQISPEGRFSYANSAWTRMSGLTHEEARDGGWMRAMRPAVAARVSAGWEAAFSKKAEYRGEAPWIHADGHETWIDIIARPIIEEGDVLAGYIGVAVDITERKLMEFELDAARRKAEAAADAKSTFLANMSHELRTPMNGVLGFTDLLLSERLTDRQHRHAQLIAESGRAMMRLLNDILDVSKIEAGQMQLAEEPLNLRTKLQVCINLMQPLAAQKGVEMQMHIADAVPHLILGDPLRVRQIILNLLGNAVKFTHEGRISLDADMIDTDDKPQLQIKVTDTGIGIPEKQIDSVFQSFAQADSTIARKYGGSGLGLAICNNLIRLMNGTLSVESKEGVGTTFTITLPVQEADPGVEEAVEEIAPANHGTVRARILVAEDNDINQELIRSMGDRLGLNIDIAANGEDAVHMVVTARDRGRPYDMVLMDVQMPIVDGIEATRRLREKGIDATQLPIIAITANAYAEDIEACLNAGMQAHLAKPMTMYALRQTIETWTNARTSQSDRQSPEQTDTLQARYDRRKTKIFDAIETAIASDTIAPADLENIVDLLHKLAGTAGIFGEDRLGDMASQVEHALRAQPDQAKAILTERFDSLNRAESTPQR